MFVRAIALPFAVAATLALSACDAAQQPKAAEPKAQASESVSVTDATIRLNANPAAPSAAYFTLTGGAVDRELVGVSSPEVGRAELHESVMEGGMMQMEAVTAVAIPAGGTVTFRSGGKHVMLFDISEAARAAGKLTLTLSFRDGEAVTIDAPLSAIGAAAADEHQGH